jgi:hypothetical protein
MRQESFGGVNESMTIAIMQLLSEQALVSSQARY